MAADPAAPEIRSVSLDQAKAGVQLAGGRIVLVVDGAKGLRRRVVRAAGSESVQPLENATEPRRAFENVIEPPEQLENVIGPPQPAEAPPVPAPVEQRAGVRRCRLSGLNFETNKTFLLPAAMTGIRQLVKLFNSFEGIVALVNGHTDAQLLPGFTPEHNRGLSVERSEAIASFLEDDAAAWQRFYAGAKHFVAWGLREDQFMLATLKDADGSPLYRGKVDGLGGPLTTAAYKAFQHSRGLAETGAPNPDTRLELSRAYMAIDGTSLPAGAKVQSHGCGQTHPLPETEGDSTPNQPKNRRVEVFLFEEKIDPEPENPCPPNGCSQHAEWVRKQILDVDLDQPPGSAVVEVVDESGNPVANAKVHLSGPLPLDADAVGGSARFGELVPGEYTAAADAPERTPANATLLVPPGGEAKATLVLEEAVSDLEVVVEDTADKPNPVAGATVTSDRAGVSPQTTNAEGRATLPRLRRGRIRLTASREGFGTTSVDTVVEPREVEAAVREGDAPKRAIPPAHIPLPRLPFRLQLVEFPGDLTPEAKEVTRQWIETRIVLRTASPAGAPPPAQVVPEPTGALEFRESSSSTFVVEQVKRETPFAVPILWKIRNGPVELRPGGPARNLELSARARVSIWCDGKAGPLLDDKKAKQGLVRINRDAFKNVRGLDDISFVQTVQMKSGSDGAEFDFAFLPFTPKQRLEFLKDAIAFLHSLKIQVCAGFEIVTAGEAEHQKKRRKQAAEFADFLGKTSDFAPAAKKLVDFFDNQGLDIDGICYDLEIDGPQLKTFRANNARLRDYFFAVADKLAEKGRFLSYATGQVPDNVGLLIDQPFTLARHPNIVVRPMAYPGPRERTVKAALATDGLHPSQIQVGVGTDQANKFEVTIEQFDAECEALYRKNRVGVVHWHLASRARLDSTNGHNDKLNPGEDPPGTLGQPLQAPLGPQRVQAFADGKKAIEEEKPEEPRKNAVRFKINTPTPETRLHVLEGETEVATLAPAGGGFDLKDLDVTKEFRLELRDPGRGLLATWKLKPGSFQEATESNDSAVLSDALQRIA